jgi:hypothetical protein
VFESLDSRYSSRRIRHGEREGDKKKKAAVE